MGLGKVFVVKQCVLNDGINILIFQYLSGTCYDGGEGLSFSSDHDIIVLLYMYACVQDEKLHGYHRRLLVTSLIPR